MEPTKRLADNQLQLSPWGRRKIAGPFFLTGTCPVRIGAYARICSKSAKIWSNAIQGGKLYMDTNALPAGR